MIRPMRDNIIVRRVPNPDEHWLIPDVLRQKSLRGEVVAIGPGTRLKSGRLAPCQVKPGDVIAFGETASKHPFAHNNSEHWDAEDELIVLSEKDILGVIE